MKLFFTIFICFYLILKFVVSFSEMIDSKNNKEYFSHFVELIIQFSLVFGFIYLFK